MGLSPNIAVSATQAIPANQPITIFWSGILGPLSTPSTVQGAIQLAFANTNFVVADVEIPVVSIDCTVVGAFMDTDGAAHSGAGRNLLESEVETFFTGVMKGVSGLYEVWVDTIVTGAQTPGAPTWANISGAVSDAIDKLPSMTTLGIGIFAAVLIVVVVAVATNKVA